MSRRFSWYDCPCQNRRTWATFAPAADKLEERVMDRLVDRRRSRMVHACALAVMAACLASADASLAKPPEPAAERIKLFEWFSTLGYPDVKNARFVRYPRGFDGKPLKVLFEHGFLLGESKDAWTVLTCDLKQQQVPKKPWFPPTRPADWACHREDLRAFANAMLASQAKSKSDDDSDFGYWRHSKTTGLFFLGWACSRQGIDGPAAKLFETVTDLRDRKLGLPPGVATLQRRIAADVAHQEFIEAQIDLGHDENSREKVLARLESIPKKFPALETVSWAQEMARVLRPMVQEDRVHAERERLQKPFAARSRKEQIAELIFQLREQHGKSFSLHDRVNIFADFRSRGESPAQRLLKIGYDAVPQLIDALSDERFSRTLDFKTDLNEPRLSFRYHVLTVGDCALQILERLARRQFFKDFESHLSQRPRLIAAVKEDALRWKAEVDRELKQKGERQVLIDGMQSADGAGTNLAEPLLAKYPEAAMSALAAAARKATDKQVMLEFVVLMDRKAGKELIPTLLDELKNSPSLDERITVATLLLKYKRTEGVAPLIEEWKQSSVRSVPSDTLVELAFYLGKCGKADAVAALALGLDQRPAKVRLAAVGSVARNDSIEVIGRSLNYLTFLYQGAGRKSLLPEYKGDAALSAAIVNLLIGELQDTEPAGDGPGRWGDTKFSDPRIADVAAQVLHELDPGRFPFDLSAPPADRDRQRVLLVNAWRKTRNLPELPVEKPRSIPPVAEQKLMPLLDRLQQVKADARDAVERDVEKLGPGAVSGILKRRDQLKAADPFRSILERLARRGAHTVVEIEFAERSLKPSGKVAARIDALKNKPLDTATLVGLVIGLTNELTLPVHGCRLHVSRLGPGSGVVVRVDLLDKARNNALRDGNQFPPIPLRPDGLVAWQNSLYAQYDEQGVSGVSGIGLAVDRGELQILGNAASGADLSRPLEIKIEYVGQWIE
jgi:hypothetical protein